MHCTHFTNDAFRVKGVDLRMDTQKDVYLYEGMESLDYMLQIC